MNHWTPVRGEVVVVWRDNGTALVSTVRDAGEQQGIAVVWVEGVSGFYAQRMVRPAIIHGSAHDQLAATLAGM